jgi:pimeloyl-ACP methyl ester carboxylesterase
MSDVTVAPPLSRQTVATRRGITCEVLTGEPASGQAEGSIVSFLGAAGQLGGEPMLAELATRFAVYAPVWPGYGEAGGEEALEDMQDFALHGADVVEALGLSRPHLLGHSMGGMIAAEMAAAAPHDYGRVALFAPLGLWLDAMPVPDIYSLLPFEFPPLLFHDAAAGTALMAGGLDFNDTEAIKTFLIGNSRRLGTAGKILFPIPDRQLAKRIYRITNPTLLVWGDDDRYLPLAYAAEWQRLVEGSRLEVVADAGHMAPYERPGEVASVVAQFLAS